MRRVPPCRTIGARVEAKASVAWIPTQPSATVRAPSAALGRDHFAGWIGRSVFAYSGHVYYVTSTFRDFWRLYQVYLKTTGHVVSPSETQNPVAKGSSLSVVLTSHILEGGSAPDKSVGNAESALP